jgi:hypothetical protein
MREARLGVNKAKRNVPYDVTLQALAVYGLN